MARSCYYCGSTQTNTWWMHRVEEQSGRSGGSWSFRLKADRSGSHGARYNTGRKYYRLRKVPVCDVCDEEIQNRRTARGCLGVIVCSVIVGLYIWSQVKAALETPEQPPMVYEEPAQVEIVEQPTEPTIFEIKKSED